MGKFCETYKCGCTCATCEGKVCGLSSRTRSDAEILRGVKLDKQGNVVQGAATYSGAQILRVDPGLALPLPPSTSRRLSPTTLVLLGSAAVVAIAACVTMIAEVRMRNSAVAAKPEVVAMVEEAPAPQPEVAVAPTPTLPPELVLDPFPAPRDGNPFLLPEVLAEIEDNRATGNAAVLNGDFVGARVYYEAAIKLNPNYYPGYNNLGNTYSDTGELLKAEPLYRQGLSIKPDSAIIIFNLGNANFRADRFDEAYQHFRRVSLMDPKDGEAITMVGVCAMRMGRWDEAARALKASLEVTPGSAATRYNLSIAYDKLGDRSLAEALLREARRIDPRIGTSRSPLAPVRLMTRSEG